MYDVVEIFSKLVGLVILLFVILSRYVEIKNKNSIELFIE